MNMIEFGYFFAAFLIATVAIVRGYSVMRQLRGNWLNRSIAAGELASSWVENELNAARAESTPPRYI